MKTAGLIEVAAETILGHVIVRGLTSKSHPLRPSPWSAALLPSRYAPVLEPQFDKATSAGKSPRIFRLFAA